MKFREEVDLVLGLRFYVMVSNDEYEIFSTIYIDTEKKEVTLLNEETFDTKVVDLEGLDKYYTLLTDYNKLPMISIVGFNKRKRKRFTNTNIVTYRFMRKKVFNKIIESICKYNSINMKHFFEKELWLRYISGTYDSFDKFYIIDEKKVDDIGKAVEDKNYKLPNVVFSDIEDYLHTVITSYDVYRYDDSVDLSNIKSDYFILYSTVEDDYFIFLYNKDDSLYKPEYDSNVKDLVDFMNAI